MLYCVNCRFEISGANFPGLSLTSAMCNPHSQVLSGMIFFWPAVADAVYSKLGEKQGAAQHWRGIVGGGEHHQSIILSGFIHIFGVQSSFGWVSS